jgi:hypothetical protein
MLPLLLLPLQPLPFEPNRISVTRCTTVAEFFSKGFDYMIPVKLVKSRLKLDASETAFLELAPTQYIQHNFTSNEAHTLKHRPQSTERSTRGHAQRVTKQIELHKDGTGAA